VSLYLSNNWKFAAGARGLPILLMPVIIHRKEKCAWNAISLFIGLLTTKMMRLLEPESRNGHNV
jgi:hypothetical protein